MYSKCGEGAGLLKRIKEEGNTVELCILEKDYSSVYDGILKKSSSPDDDAIIIFDSSGMGARAESLRSAYKVFGASNFHDKLENDRCFGLEFMVNNGIMIPETASFKDFSQGIDFVKENKDTRYVFKPSGKNLPCRLTYSCSDTEDLILFMKYVEKAFGKEVEDFILQEFFEGAIISTEFWVGKGGFIEPLNHTIEVKKFLNDDLGPSTGCSGNIVWVGDEDEVFNEMLSSIEGKLIQEGYIGPIDINCIVNEEGIYGLEWTPRFGLDAMPTFLQLIGQDVGKLISDSFDDRTKHMDLMDIFAGGIRVTIPPYPIEPENLKSLQKNFPNENIPIRGLDECEQLCYFYEVKKEDDLLLHSAGTGVIACISDIGFDPKSCFDSPCKILEEAKIPDAQYRTDLDKVLPEMYEEVKEVLDACWA